MEDEKKEIMIDKYPRPISIEGTKKILEQMEKCICIEHLFEKLDLPCKLNVKKDGMGIIQNIKYESVESAKSYVHSIQSFIDIFPNFRKFSNRVEDIIDLEEKIELDVALNAYFKDLRALIKQQKIIKRFSHATNYRNQKKFPVSSTSSGVVRIGVPGKRADFDEAIARRQNQTRILGVFR